MRGLELQFESSLATAQPRLDVAGDGVNIPFPDRAFPDNAHPPIRLGQLALVPDVPRHVHIEFRPPEFGSCCRGFRVAAALVTMPEAPVHEEHGLEARQDKIRTSRKLFAMEPISQTSAMQRPSQQEFRASILSADARHHPRPCGGIYHISHAIFPGDNSPTWYWASTMTNRLRR